LDLGPYLGLRSFRLPLLLTIILSSITIIDLSAVMEEMAASTVKVAVAV
jgi:hypothetical protein